MAAGGVDEAVAAGCRSQSGWIEYCKRAKAAHGYDFDSVVSDVRPWLCLGGRPGTALAPAQALLDHRGHEGRRVTHVINCLAQEEDDTIVAAFHSAGRILTLGLEDDDDDQKMALSLPKAAAFVRAARQAVPNALVYVHCMSGVNRAPSVSAAVLCSEERCSLLVALSAIRAVRPAMRPKYVKEVALYEERLLGVASSVPALRDGLGSGELAQSYYGLKNDHSQAGQAAEASTAGADALPPAAPRKKRDRAAPPAATKRAREGTAGGGASGGASSSASGVEESERARYQALHQQLSHRAPTQKEIESSKPGEPSFMLEVTD